jgi:hypothetical protein
MVMDNVQVETEAVLAADQTLEAVSHKREAREALDLVTKENLPTSY